MGRFGGVTISSGELNQNERPEKQVGGLLRGRNLKIAVAESCTGGLISHLLTNIPGSSDYFIFGVVVYSNAAKMQILDVPKLVLDSCGAVSAETARAMAENVRKLAATDIGLAVTGIAGPGGGTSTKPVGLVFIGLASSEPTVVKEFRFAGERLKIKEQTAYEALRMVLDSL